MSVGMRLGRGEALADILARTSQVAEGVKSSRAVLDLAQRHGVEMPIVEQVVGICHGGVSAADGLAASRIALVPELLGKEALGGFVVAVPSQSQLLCVPLKSARSLDALQILASALGHALTTSDEVLSDQLYWYDGSKWTPITVVHSREEVTVLPPPSFVRTMNRLAAMDLVRIAGEA